MDVLPDDDLLPLAEGAKLMRIGVTTAYALAKKGQLPGAVKIGGRWRFSLIRYRREVHGDEAA